MNNSLTALRLRVRQLLADRRGANMAEYVMVLALVLLICIAGFTTLGSAIKAEADKIAGQIK